MVVRPLSLGVAAVRHQHDLDVDSVSAVVRGRIEGHVLAMQATIDALIAGHKRVTQEIDFDMSAETRWVAVWEMSGRCISLANAVVDQLRRGFGSEAMPTARSLHEANRLLLVFACDEEADVTRRWLQDIDVPAKAVARRLDAVQRRAEAEASRLRLEGRLADLSRQIYRLVSSAAHNRRTGFAECVSRPMRSYSYGPHPDPRATAPFVLLGSEKVEETALEVGGALGARFLGEEWRRSEIQPLITGLHAIRDTHPLSDGALAVVGPRSAV